MIVGLSGKKGSGKDTAYKFIKVWAKERALPIRRDAFADRLKLSAARVFFPDIDLHSAIRWCNEMKQTGTVTVSDIGSHDDAYTISGREYLQNYGTEAHRHVFGLDFWINHVRDQYLSGAGKEIVIVTDVRFDNEAEMVRDVGGEVWEIRRPDIDDGDDHASEKPIHPRLIDRVIPNDGDLEQFKKLVLVRIELSMLNDQTFYRS